MTRLYHGSDVLVHIPVAYYARANANPDFGRGFYLTEHLDQAAEWAVKKARRRLSRTHTPVVSVFTCNTAVLKLGQSVVHRFAGYSGGWLEYVKICRSLDAVDKSGYGLVIGKVADDDVYDTVRLYENNVITKDEALRRLRQPDATQHYVQWCFRDQHLLDRYVSFDKAETRRVNELWRGNPDDRP